MEKVLIVGSKGFIGSYLKSYLLSMNYDVYGADIIYDNTNNKKYFFLNANNLNYDFIFEKSQFDHCINCSGGADVAKSLKFPIDDFQLNANNVFKILDAIFRLQPSCRFINLSSAAVYGNPKCFPIREDFHPNPVSPYGYHKLMSELICEEFHKQFNLFTCSLRIFSAFGIGLKKQLFYDLYNKSKLNKQVKLFGTGNESRDFIYIDDLAQAIYKVAINTEYKSDIINVANGQEISIKDAVASFYCLFDVEIDYRFSGLVHRGYPDNWVADISKLKQFGYVQKYSLKEGLENYYRWLIKEN